MTSLKSKRNGFEENRLALSDSEFVFHTSARPEEYRFIVAARQALAHVCHVHPSHIYPDDNPKLLAALVRDWDDVDVIMELENILQTPINDTPTKFPRFLSGRFFWWKWQGSKTVGEWTLRIAEYLNNESEAKN